MPDSDLTAAQRRLTAARTRQRRRAAGPPLSVTDADLDALAEVGPSLMAEVEAMVRDAAGQQGVDMLRAKRGEG